MQVVEHWYCDRDPDGFPNLFILDDGSYVFTSEKQTIHMDASLKKVLGEAYKCGMQNRALDSALEQAETTGIPIPIPFDRSKRRLWNKVMR